MSEPCFACMNPECHGMTFSKRISCPRCQSPAQSIYPRASPDKTPEAAIVLVLDGGGMKGLSSLFILKALMEEVHNELKARKAIGTDEEPLPGHYFTFIMGTSTGGIIATMQGIFGLSVSECIKEYMDIGEHIFARPRHFHARTLIFFPRAKYDSDDFENCVSTFINNKNLHLHHPPPRHPPLHYFKKFVKPRLKKSFSLGYQIEASKHAEQETKPDGRFSRPGALCKTVVFASKGNREFLFRSYDHEKSTRHGNLLVLNPGKACEASIVDVIRASSAAPSYFRQVEIDAQKLCLQDPNTSGTPEVFIDGGIAANNPSPLAWDEAYAWQMGISGKQYSSVADAIGCIVSIGCGRTHWQMVSDATTAPIRKYAAMLFSLSKIVTEAGPAHRTAREKARYNNVPYFRFNVHRGLEETKMDEWRDMERKIDDIAYKAGKKISTREYIEEVTRRYVDGETQKTDDRDDYPDENRKTTVREDLKMLAQMLVNYKLARDSTTRERLTTETLAPPNTRGLVDDSRSSARRQTADNEDAIEPAP